MGRESGEGEEGPGAVNTPYREGQAMKTRRVWGFNSSFDNSTPEQKLYTIVSLAITAGACFLWVIHGLEDRMTERLCKLAAVLLSIMLLTRIERKAVQNDQ